MKYPAPLEYAPPGRSPTAHLLTSESVGRFFTGLGFYVGGVLLIVGLRLFGHLLGDIGWILNRESFLWLLALCALALVVYVQVRWHLTAFTLGVAAGVLVSLVAAGIFFAWLWHELNGVVW